MWQSWKIYTTPTTPQDLNLKNPLISLRGFPMKIHAQASTQMNMKHIHLFINKFLYQVKLEMFSKKKKTVIFSNQTKPQEKRWTTTTSCCRGHCLLTWSRETNLNIYTQNCKHKTKRKKNRNTLKTPTNALVLLYTLHQKSVETTKGRAAIKILTADMEEQAKKQRQRGEAEQTGAYRPGAL